MAKVRHVRIRPTHRIRRSWPWMMAVVGIVTGGILWWVNRDLQQNVQLYWLSARAGRLEYITQPYHVWSQTPEQSISASVRLLLNGSSNSDWFSAIPKATRLLSVRMEGEDIFLNLSGDFAEGAGARSLEGRLVQLVYTVTSNQPHSRVWLTIDGKAMPLLSGDGLELPQPLSRESLQETFPDLQVLQPSPEPSQAP